VKWSIVESGRRKWPLHFAGLFEATCVSGLTLDRPSVVMAISCRGVFILDEPTKVLVGLHYYELVDAIYVRLMSVSSHASASEIPEVISPSPLPWSWGLDFQVLGLESQVLGLYLGLTVRRA